MRIVELGAIGPVPFAAMMLADHGAEVIRIARRGETLDIADPLLRNRISIQLDLKSEEDRKVLLQLVAGADGLIEGYRPGVLERLGLGPDVLLGKNPKLVVGRMTGWGQFGPYVDLAGHDINYIAATGVLSAIGREGEKPVPPLNLVGDFGGGAMMLAFGMLAALHAVAKGEAGQVVDCAMTDGSALLMNMMWGFFGKGEWKDQRGMNILDSGAPFYEVYETSDGHHIALGAIEPQFFAELLATLQLSEHPLLADQMDASQWPEQKRFLGELFRTRTRDAWAAVFTGRQACFTPVRSLSEARHDKHNDARSTFVEVGGIVQAAPAPRYSGTVCSQPSPARPLAENLDPSAIWWFEEGILNERR